MAITPDDLRRAILGQAASRLAESEEDSPDEDAQADADEMLAALDEPAFSELLAKLNAEEEGGGG